MIQKHLHTIISVSFMILFIIIAYYLVISLGFDGIELVNQSLKRGDLFQLTIGILTSLLVLTLVISIIGDFVNTPLKKYSDKIMWPIVYLMIFLRITEWIL